MDSKFLKRTVESIKPHTDEVVAHATEIEGDKTKADPEHVLNHLYAAHADLVDAINHVKQDQDKKGPQPDSSVVVISPTKAPPAPADESESFLKRNWRVLAAAAGAVLLVAAALLASPKAHAQTTCGAYSNPCSAPTFNPNAYQVSTAGNAGNLTWNLSQGLDGTYSKIGLHPVTQDFSGVIQADLSGYYTSDADAIAAGGGWVVTSMSWILDGTNGGYSCGKGCAGTDLTIVSQVSIVPAEPLLDASGKAVVGPGYGADSPLGTIPQWAPVAGETALYADGTPVTFSTSGNAQLSSGVLRPGKYLVAFTATGCTGRGCGITSYRYFFSHVTWASHYVAPPPPPPCTTCGDD